MKSIFLGLKQFFPKRSVNVNNLMFRAFGATLFSYLNYRYFNSFNVVEEKNTLRPDFGLKAQIPSANF